MDLRYFINQCEAANELKRVAAEVDWNLEISHVSKLTEEKKGPALLFENIKGYSSPVFTGAFATTKRLAIMLGLPHHLTMCESARAWMKKTITSEGLIKANEVKDGQVGPLASQDMERRLTVAGGQNRIACLLQVGPHNFQDGFVIVHDQNSLRHAAIVTEKPQENVKTARPVANLQNVPTRP